MSFKTNSIILGMNKNVCNGLTFRLRAHGGCDRSAEDAYSSMALNPALVFVEGPCCPTLDFVCVFWTMITFNTLLLRHFISKVNDVTIHIYV